MVPDVSERFDVANDKWVFSRICHLKRRQRKFVRVPTNFHDVLDRLRQYGPDPVRPKPLPPKDVDIF